MLKRIGSLLCALTFAALSAFFLAAAASAASASPSPCPSCVADFAVYDPAEASHVDGVWSYETQSLQKMFAIFGWSSKVVDARFVNGGGLGNGASRKFRALIMPGGFSVPRTEALKGAGVRAIEAFVSSGGNYLSFCAGSYYASTSDVWADKASGTRAGKIAYNTPQDYAAYHGLPRPRFFKGRAQGPYGWFVWNGGAAFRGWEPARLNLAVPTLKAIGAPAIARFMYYGGPFFEFEQQPKDLEIWARSIAPKGLSSDSTTGAGKPTIVRFGFGQGKVTLFSYHPVFLLNGSFEGVRSAELQGPMPVPALGKETAPLGEREMNYQTWNVLHAALQLARGEQPAPIDRAAVVKKLTR